MATVVGIANVPPPTVTNPPLISVPFDCVVGRPGTSYTISDVQALPMSSQNDTFLQGALVAAALGEGRRCLAERRPSTGRAYLSPCSVFDAGTQNSSGLPTRTFSFPN